MVQDAVYNRLLTPTRQELHERAAQAIERRGAANLQEWVDSLADHYKHPPRADKTVHYMAQAGAKSLQVYSLEEAERRFRGVIDLIDAVPGCADETLLSDVLLKMARLYYYRGQFCNIISLAERYLSRVRRLFLFPVGRHMNEALSVWREPARTQQRGAEPPTQRIRLACV